MQRRCVNAAAIEIVDLILHERDQRRNDQRRTRQNDSRELIAERLARPCRHHRPDVFAAHHGGDEPLLPTAKRSMLKAIAKSREEIERRAWHGRLDDLVIW